MEVREFQERLAQISELGKRNDNALDAGMVREFFRSAALDQGQLLKVIQYLRAQGISVTANEEESAEAAEAQKEKTVLPLSEEEEAYWKEYQESLQAMPVSERDVNELFQALADADLLAQTELVQHYMLAAAELAVEMNCEEMHISDLIQEANVSLVTALAEANPPVKSDQWLRAAVRKGIQDAIDVQLQTKYSDDALVQKVERLEQAIRDLNEDEENPNAEKFTAAEISVILDMPLDELKAILRLTGDDK